MSQYTIKGLDAINRNIVELKLAEVRYLKSKTVYDKKIIAVEIIAILNNADQIHGSSEEENKLLASCQKAHSTWEKIIAHLDDLLNKAT